MAEKKVLAWRTEPLTAPRERTIDRVSLTKLGRGRNGERKSIYAGLRSHFPLANFASVDGE